MNTLITIFNSFRKKQSRNTGIHCFGQGKGKHVFKMELKTFFFKLGTEYKSATCPVFKRKSNLLFGYFKQFSLQIKI